MKTPDSHSTLSDQKSSSTSESVQMYSVLDEQGELIGKVERIYKNSSDQIQIIFSLLGQSRPLFKIHQKSILKVDVDQNLFFINLTDQMREKINQYSERFRQNITPQNDIESVDDPDDPLEPEINHSNSSPLENETIRLLAERLEVNHERRKIGEVIVRKTIETEMVQVPVQREKLIIEQVGSSDKPLAEIDLSQTQIKGVELRNPQPHQVTVNGEFVSLKAASDLLQIIAMEDAHGCAKVRVELVLNDPQYQQKYQELFDRCTHS